MRDNPLNVAVYGEDPERRRRSLERVFRAMFRIIDTQRPICGIYDNRLVGVAGITPSGSCQPSAVQRLRFLPETIAIGPAASQQIRRWLAEWRQVDPDRPHSHLGPLAVDPDHQGLGIGRQLMSEYCRRLDCKVEVSYLETDKAENVSFYARYGYQVIGEKEVIGAPNWFMLREPAMR
ncbi:MAG: GNAT family N-acetyltransferase [Solirubrobacterales bacterium]